MTIFSGFFGPVAHCEEEIKTLAVQLCESPFIQKRKTIYEYFVLQVGHISCNCGWGTSSINAYFLLDDISHTKLSKMGPHCSDFTAANFADFAGAPRPVELRVPQFTYL